MVLCLLDITESQVSSHFRKNYIAVSLDWHNAVVVTPCSLLSWDPVLPNWQLWNRAKRLGSRYQLVLLAPYQPPL